MFLFKPITDFLSVAVVATEAVSSSKSNKPPSKLIFFGGFGFSASLSFGTPCSSVIAFHCSSMDVAACWRSSLPFLVCYGIKKNVNKLLITCM